MKIILGSDNRGKEIRNVFFEYLLSQNHEVFATEQNNPDSVDYPDIAACVAFHVSSGFCDSGILICGTGIGMCVVANKFPGVRAAPCHNEVVAELSRKHNNANILCLAGDLLGDQTSLRIVQKWLATSFDDGHHSNRLEKIRNLELNNYSQMNILENSDWGTSENYFLELVHSVQNQTVCSIA